MSRTPVRMLGPRGLMAESLELDGLEFVLFRFVPEPLVLSGLTVSENAVVALLGRGYSTAEIADSRRVSYRTIANQLSSIYRKLSVNSRAELFAVLKRSAEELLR